jgi:hypothetical protein
MTSRTFTFTVEAPVTSPAWSRAANGSQLTDFQVRNLTTTTSGKWHLASSTTATTGDGVIPGIDGSSSTHWNVNADGWGAHAIMFAWCGGRGDVANRRLIITGGGHNNGANNGVYVYDFGFGNTPIGWRLAGESSGSALGGYSATSASNTSSLTSLSTLYDGVNVRDTTPGISAQASMWTHSITVYPDNRPTAIHTYDQLAYDPNLGRFYRFAGAASDGLGKGCPAAYYFDLNTGRWNSHGTGAAFINQVTATADGTGTTGNAGTLIASPDGAKLLYIPAGMNFTFYSSAGALLGTSGATGIPTGYGLAVSATYGTRSQTADKIVLMHGTVSSYTGPTALYELTVNWNTNTVTKSANYYGSYSNSTYLGSHRGAGSVFHDALNSCYWCFGTIADTYLSGTGNMGTQILKINDHTTASPYQISAFTLTGDTIAFGQFATPFGSNGRHVWFPDLRVVATVQHATAPMSIIRIPGSQV